jgi:hypothetical protein
MREQTDEVFDFLNQLAKLHFGSALGEFIQMGVLSASGHPVLHKTAILTEAKTVRAPSVKLALCDFEAGVPPRQLPQRPAGLFEASMKRRVRRRADR